MDDEPSYGEVPGTDAYKKRTQDATPDEIAIVHDKKPESISPDRPLTPGGHPIPKTVVDEAADTPGSSTHRYHEDLRQADAAPDFIRKPDGTGEANPTPSSLDTSKEATGTAAKSF